MAATVTSVNLSARMPKEGIFAIVLEGGDVSVGDEITVVGSGA